MASKAITGLGGEWTEAKRSMGNVAIDGIATSSRQTDPFSSTTTGAQSTYLEASQFPSALIHHQHQPHIPSLYHGHHWKWPICLLIIKKHSFLIYSTTQKTKIHHEKNLLEEKLARSMNQIQTGEREREGGKDTHMDQACLIG